VNQYTRGIDLKYRPSSYFWAKERGIALISDIKGAERRKLYEMALQSGLANMVEPELLQHALPSDQRQAQGRIHPAFMGGEYLPNRRPGEVEIARITIASTTQDVTCVYARPVGQRIHYRVVDEYGGDTLDGRGHRTSLQPLTLKQLSDLFLKSWDMICCLRANFESDGYPRDFVHGFIVDASSSFYSEFGDLIHARIEEWLDKVAPLQEGEEEELDDE
jgi:hypothetical protein